MGPAACLRDLARPHRGGLVICHVHHGEPAQKLLGLDVWSVGDHQGATGGVGAVDRAVLLLQPPGKDVHARSLHLDRDRLGERSAPAEPLLGVVADPLLVEVEEVLGHDCSFGYDGPSGPRSPTLRTARSESDTVVPETRHRLLRGREGHSHAHRADQVSSWTPSGAGEGERSSQTAAIPEAHSPEPALDCRPWTRTRWTRAS